VSFTDTLPTRLEIAAAPNIGGSCAGGTVTAAAGGSTITVTGKTVPASGVAASTCTVTVDVTNVTGQLKASCTSKSGGVHQWCDQHQWSVEPHQCRDAELPGGQRPDLLDFESGECQYAAAQQRVELHHHPNQQRTFDREWLDPDRSCGVKDFVARQSVVPVLPNNAACPSPANVTLANLQGAGDRAADVPGEQHHHVPVEWHVHAIER
jgi:hypothetical protein